MISILLASYNGEKFITEQLDSLYRQTVQDFKLFICDDKSTDNTVSIISGYAEKRPGKISIEQNENNTGGAKHNFMKMMIEHKDDYVMLCDQDDVWLPDKIEKSLRKMHEMEQEFGKDTPILVHSDLKVVDRDLKKFSSSYQKTARLNYAKKSLNKLVTMNMATGCTAIYNRALADLITAEPDFYVIHDWWLALIAISFGKIGTIFEPTVLYRQHGDNDIGAKKVLSTGYIHYFLTHLDIMSEKVYNTYLQAGAFLRLYSDKLTEDQRILLKSFASIPNLSRLKRLKTIAKHKTYLHGFARNTALMIIILKRQLSI
jgi:glycosyltransferase involved in cell wall biosynthesis